MIGCKAGATARERSQTSYQAFLEGGRSRFGILPGFLPDQATGVLGRVRILLRRLDQALLPPDDYALVRERSHHRSLREHISKSSRRRLTRRTRGG